MPYRHCHTQSGEEVITAYFIPAYNIVNREGYIDSRGYTDPIKGKEYYDKERAKKAGDPEAFLMYCAEYCYYPEEVECYKNQLKEQESVKFDESKFKSLCIKYEFTEFLNNISEWRFFFNKNFLCSFRCC